MENVNENVSTPVEQPLQEEIKEPKDRKSLVLIIIIVILIFLLLVVGVLYAKQSGFIERILNTQEQQEDEEITEEQEEEDPTVMNVTIEGDTIRALVPEGWTVEEYYDGEGTESLVGDVTYEGFTGLKIMNGNKEVFSLRAVSGIGFIGCPMYAKFEDYSPEHLTENQSMANEIGETMNITDYSTAEYIQFEWLDRTFRRINQNYFYDDIPNNEFFEAPCMQGVVTFSGLQFVDSFGYTGTAYFFGADENATSEELLIVDEILESMELVN